MSLPFDAFVSSRCLVTGGLGFIGSNTATALTRAGATVTVIDALLPRHGGDRANLAGTDAEVIVADIGDADAVTEAVATADFIFNIAGQVSHTDSMTDPVTDFTVNAVSQLHFLEIVRSVNPHVPLVYTSTRQVYGRTEYLPVDEAHPIAPIDVNGVSKYAAERLHLIYAAAHGLQASAMRVTNVYGPRQCLDAAHHGFLPLFLRLALDGEAIRVFGDGSQLRDCLHVDDVVRALALAVCTPKAVGHVFNLGTAPMTLREIAETISEVAGGAGIRMVAWPSDRAVIDVGSYHADWSAAKRAFGWKPTIGFRQGISTTIAEHRRAAVTP